MHARYFSLHLGRFLSVDPVGGAIGSSQSWNRYAYVRGNPINSTDPTGMLTNQYGGPGDQTVNVANAGTTETVWDAWWTSIPAVPTSGSQRIRLNSGPQSSFGDTLRAAIAETFDDVLGNESPRNTSIELQLLEFGYWLASGWRRVEHTISPYLVGSSAVIAGSASFGAGFTLFGASVLALPETCGLSVITAGASFPVMLFGSAQVVWGVSVVINQTNILFETHIPSPSDKLPEEYFPRYPSAH